MKFMKATLCFLIMQFNAGLVNATVNLSAIETSNQNYYCNGTFSNCTYTDLQAERPFSATLTSELFSSSWCSDDSLCGKESTILMLKKGHTPTIESDFIKVKEKDLTNLIFSHTNSDLRTVFWSNLGDYHRFYKSGDLNTNLNIEGSIVFYIESMTGFKYVTGKTFFPNQDPPLDPKTYC